MAELRNTCPMAVEGVNVDVSDTKTGVALTFTTNTGDIDDLRRRTQHMADMYRMHGGRGGMMWHHMGGKGMGAGMGQGMGRGQGMGPMHGPMPEAMITVENVDKGARIVLTPKDASQLDALREHVRNHQARMHSGQCWMLQGASSNQGAEKSGQ